MKSPIFFYYGLENFYQNQRDYVKSRDYGQLRGVYSNVILYTNKCNQSSSSEKNCKGATRIKEIFDGNTLRYTNQLKKTFTENDTAIPCGLVAKSLFNGKFIYEQIHFNLNLQIIQTL